jgi:peptidoglycan-N-acetylglucosamine deacetylase
VTRVAPRIRPLLATLVGSVLAAGLVATPAPAAGAAATGPATSAWVSPWSPTRLSLPPLPEADPQLITRTRGSGRRLALTLDDGPHATWTPQVLELLRAHRVRATFCVVGERARALPSLVRRIAVEGHLLCNHSQTHASMVTMTPAQIQADLRGVNATLRSLVPGATISHFRAPYGAWGASPRVAKAMGLKSLSWSVDARDWARPGAAQIIQQIRTQLRPRGVVLMHDGGGDRSQTVAALRQLVPALLREGWIFDDPA